MKLLLALLFFFIFLNNYSQSNENAIKDIRQKYNKITKLLNQETLKEVSIASDCSGDEQNNTSVSFYYDNGKLVYIHYTNSEGHSNYDYHYYVWDTHLLFYFSEYASWVWDYECTPQDQGFTNEIWTYEENRIYFRNEKTAIKCLYKTYEEKSDDPLTEDLIKLSNITQNKEIECSQDQLNKIIKMYYTLLELKKNKDTDICNLF